MAFEYNTAQQGGLFGASMGGGGGAFTGFGLGGLTGQDPGAMFNSLTGLSASQAGAERAAGLAAFNPYGVQTGIGGVSFQDGQATTTLDPRLQGISNQMFGQGQGFLEQLGSFDPMQATQQQFGLMESIMNPIRQREQAGMESQLLAQGRLGSTGGALTQQGQQQAFDTARQQQLFNAMQQSQQTQQHLAGLGSGLIGQGIGIEQLPLGLVGMGGQLGGLQAQAGATQGRFLSDAANRKSDLFGNILGGAASGAAMGMFSDRRLKKDITNIGTYRELPIYKFKYIWEDTYTIGMMADEIEELYPEVISEVNGFKKVNYNKLMEML